MIVVEQLNRSQWHAIMPDGTSNGVRDYVSTVSHALLVSMIRGFAVQTVSYDCGRLLLAREGVDHG